ncbi:MULTISPECIES: response regulator [Commensalibacter]|uniref:Regulatory protein VirG n=2 Tax=Commensalibacter TaxID=1079922 RepID=W7DS08_9PROT|nr:MULTISPECIES: response regulator transcription factor [Commensalibacter]EUK17665.1 two component response regulator [Commensalibacter papalotli (ex Servin-Garciduenas et al. 2014)]CAI3954001.1 DNA-binding response regulator [Commensalibacter papalotli (ex Botero et al. 2024)]CAI3954500.1 DNA-binding response regulator [Commensalibacter papalotli (ex Botero et al. 2024)]
MEHPAHLLIIDDDHEIVELLCQFLKRHHFEVSYAYNGEQTRQVWKKNTYNLVILDLMLPGESGFEIAHWLRQQDDIPIIMLTAMGEEADRIIGLELGADDYLAKPFNPRELLARIHSVLHRSRRRVQSTLNQQNKSIQFGEWVLNPISRQLLNIDKSAVPLTGKEYDLLLALLEHAPKIVNRDQLSDILYGHELPPTDRTIDVTLSRLRRKLQDDGRQSQIIKTVHRGGYLIAVPVRHV